MLRVLKDKLTMTFHEDYNLPDWFELLNIKEETH